MSDITISTQDQLADHKTIKTLGFVSGSTVRSRNAARNFLAGFRTIIGGEIPELTKAVAEAREQALDRLTERAKDMGANAVLAIRLITTEVNEQCSEIVAYGTAAQVEKL
jgi:uncharacterized protein YbjQ (UPF0145 family)